MTTRVMGARAREEGIGAVALPKKKKNERFWAKKFDTILSKIIHVNFI